MNISQAISAMKRGCVVSNDVTLYHYKFVDNVIHKSFTNDNIGIVVQFDLIEVLTDTWFIVKK